MKRKRKKDFKELLTWKEDVSEKDVFIRRKM